MVFGLYVNDSLKLELCFLIFILIQDCDASNKNGHSLYALCPIL